MSEQNKNTGTAPGGTMDKPASADNGGTTPTKDKSEQAAPKTPDHEQGREHTPNVDAQKEAADTRRTEVQSHIPKASADNAVTAGNSAAKPRENEADDARKPMTEGQGDRKPGNDPGKHGDNR